MENNSAEGDLNSECPAEDVSEEAISMWPKDHSCNVLPKNVTAS